MNLTILVNISLDEIDEWIVTNIEKTDNESDKLTKNQLEQKYLESHPQFRYVNIRDFMDKINYILI